MLNVHDFLKKVSMNWTCFHVKMAYSTFKELMFIKVLCMSCRIWLMLVNKNNKDCIINEYVLLLQKLEFMACLQLITWSSLKGVI